MARNTVADYLAKTLAAAGVERIWGVTGDSLNGLAFSLDRVGSIRCFGRGGRCLACL